MVVVLVGALLAGAVVAWKVTAGNSAPAISLDGAAARSAERPLSGAQPGTTAMIADAPVETGTNPVSPSQAAPTPTVPPNSGEPAVVTGTDGVGVVLRASPKDNDWTPGGFMDGQQVVVLERAGADWARVRGANGQEGWIPTRYLSR
jgi:hypothetical protein